MELPSGPLADVDPEFERMALETGEFTYSLTGTTMREKLLQNLANDICRPHLGLAFRLHVQAAFMHAVPYADLLALIRFVAPYAGYPAAADALARLAQIAAELGYDTSIVDAPATDAVGSSATGENGTGVTDAWLAAFLDSRLSRAWSELRLSRRERAYVALTADVAQQTLGDSFRHHVELALDSGASAGEVRDAIRFCAEMGVARAVAALRTLDAVFAEH